MRIRPDPLATRLRIEEGGLPYLTQQPEHAKAPVIDLQLRRPGKAEETIGQGVEDIEKCLRHAENNVLRVAPDLNRLHSLSPTLFR